MQKIKKIVIKKVTHLKTKLKTEDVISFEDPSKIISIFEYLSSHVKAEAEKKKLIIFSTEFGYNLIDTEGKIKYEFIIDDISDSN